MLFLIASETFLIVISLPSLKRACPDTPRATKMLIASSVHIGATETSDTDDR